LFSILKEVFFPVGIFIIFTSSMLELEEERGKKERKRGGGRR